MFVVWTCVWRWRSWWWIINSVNKQESRMWRKCFRGMARVHFISVSSFPNKTTTNTVLSFNFLWKLSVSCSLFKLFYFISLTLIFGSEHRCDWPLSKHTVIQSALTYKRTSCFRDKWRLTSWIYQLRSAENTKCLIFKSLLESYCGSFVLVAQLYTGTSIIGAISGSEDCECTQNVFYNGQLSRKTVRSHHYTESMLNNEVDVFTFQLKL